MQIGLSDALLTQAHLRDRLAQVRVQECAVQSGRRARLARGRGLMLPCQAPLPRPTPIPPVQDRVHALHHGCDALRISRVLRVQVEAHCQQPFQVRNRQARVTDIRARHKQPPKHTFQHLGLAGHLRQPFDLLGVQFHHMPARCLGDNQRGFPLGRLLVMLCLAHPHRLFVLARLFFERLSLLLAQRIPAPLQVVFRDGVRRHGVPRHRVRVFPQHVGGSRQLVRLRGRLAWALCRRSVEESVAQGQAAGASLFRGLQLAAQHMDETR